MKNWERIILWISIILLIASLFMLLDSNNKLTLQLLRVSAVDQGYRLYGMDYPIDDHHEQVYVIARSEIEATQAVKQDITSVRRIDVPILVVRDSEVNVKTGPNLNDQGVAGRLARFKKSFSTGQFRGLL